MSENPPHLYILVLIESIIVEIALVGVIILNLRTLYWIRKDLLPRKILISKILTFYIVIWILVALVTLVNNTFVIAFWHPINIECNVAFLYISGAIYMSLMPLPAVASLFLTIERCLILTIHNPAKLNKLQKLLTFLDVLFTISVTAVVLEAFISSAPISMAGTTTSLLPVALSRGFVAGERFSEIRLTLAFINLLATIIFIYFLRKSKLQNKIQQAFGNLVKHVLLVQIFFDLSVHGIPQIFEAITHTQASDMFGAYARLFCALDGLFCCLLFARSIGKLRGNKVMNVNVALSSMKDAQTSNLNN